jgi:predicted metal-dependent hydrolase
MGAAPNELGEIRPRSMGFDLDDCPRHWMAGSAMATAMGNALHLIFPMGERFFVRSVKHFADQLADPELRAQVKGFYAQEGRHAHEHERVFALLERQGYDIRTFLRVYKKVAFGAIERVSPPKLRLAVTVALEHYTAIMAEDALEHGMLDRVHPTMQPLLAWHAAEEIEHKAVAFDVLKAVDDGYALRMAGMALATALLLGFWALGSTLLVRQEKIGWREALRQLRATQQASPVMRRVFMRGIREYLSRGFHPWQNDNLAAARRVLERLERSAA